MLRNTFFAVLVVLSAAAASQAAIMISGNATPTNLPQGNLVSYTLTAVGTAGEVLNTFSRPTLTPMRAADKGVHNVANAVTNSGTPSRDQQTPGLFDSSWATYDTYLLFGGPNDLALDLGTPLSETNDGSTAGMLGLNPVPAAPRSGYGNLSSGTDSTKVLVPGKAGPSVPFMQVVMRSGDFAHLDIEIVGNGGEVVQSFNDLVIGVIPEPATMSLIGLALIGLVGFARRRS
jgi:hypothetical protein